MAQLMKATLGAGIAQGDSRRLKRLEAFMKYAKVFSALMFVPLLALLVLDHLEKIHLSGNMIVPTLSLLGLMNTFTKHNHNQRGGKVQNAIFSVLFFVCFVFGVAMLFITGLNFLINTLTICSIILLIVFTVLEIARRNHSEDGA
jgi:amino acid transporter